MREFAQNGASTSKTSKQIIKLDNVSCSFLSQSSLCSAPIAIALSSNSCLLAFQTAASFTIKSATWTASYSFTQAKNMT
jgi:hypothetical protein